MPWNTTPLFDSSCLYKVELELIARERRMVARRIRAALSGRQKLRQF